jgi:hypothetical protein
MMVGVSGLSIAILVVGYVSAPADEADAARESQTTVALTGAPFVLRDGQQAVVDVVQIAFEPKAVSLSQEAQEPLQELLDRKARGCILSAQVVGAASKFETAPQPVVDAHLLALQRAGTIAQLASDSGVPKTAVASLWTVDSGLQVPHSVLWVFSSSNGSACVAPTVSSETVDVSVKPDANPDTEQAMIVNLPIQRPQPAPSADDGQTTSDPPSVPSASVRELALTFADNSSYLDAQELARLQQFASSLGPACAVTLKATVAGGADAHYASWLAERRMARVADQLSELATVANYVLVRNDASRRVVVAISDESGCPAAQKTTSAMNARL